MQSRDAYLSHRNLPAQSPGRWSPSPVTASRLTANSPVGAILTGRSPLPALQSLLMHLPC
ncbi:hypothetical protein ASPCADRAFT_209502, partial [Aspergillus carbonarius ITEM 5010]